MFTEDAIKSYNDNDLAWMLFVDGCSLLHFMENVDDQIPEKLDLKLGESMHMWRDVILLENQLPRKMLEILCKEKGIVLEYCFSNYLSRGVLKGGTVMIPVENPEPFHVLDFSRSLYLSGYKTSHFEGNNQMETQSDGNEDSQMGIRLVSMSIISDYNKKDLYWNTYKSICDLKKAGIRVMTNNRDERNWSNISFTSKWLSGELRLPIFLFNDVTPYLFRNFIAYEMCPDVPYNYECCFFFTFMDSLIDNAEDVKELRLAGIFQNFLQSDEELAKLLNELGNDLPTNMYSNFFYTRVLASNMKYFDIRSQIEKHYANKWKTWLAQAYNTHFSNPWAMLAFLAASLALVLTFIQTWFAIHPN